MNMRTVPQMQQVIKLTALHMVKQNQQDPHFKLSTGWFISAAEHLFLFHFTKAKHLHENKSFYFPKASV